MGLSNYEVSAVMLCQYICNSFGLLGVILVSILYIGYRNIRVFAFKLVLCLALSSGGYSIGLLMGPSDGVSCYIQGTIISYFSISSVLWLLIIVHSLKAVVIDRSSPEKNFKKYLILALSFPVLTSFIPAFTQTYSRTDLGMCWVSGHSSSGTALILLQIWFLLLFGFIYTAYYSYKLYKSAQKIRNERQESLEVLKYYNRLKYFTLLIFLAWFFPFINTLALISDPNSPSLTLILLHSISSGLLGVFILAAFIKDHAVYESLIDTFSGCLPCLIKKKKKTNKLELSPRV